MAEDVCYSLMQCLYRSGTRLMGDHPPIHFIWETFWKAHHFPMPIYNKVYRFLVPSFMIMGTKITTGADRYMRLRYMFFNTVSTLEKKGDSPYILIWMAC